MKLVELRCKNCGGRLGADDVSQRLAMARCGHCDTVFAIADVAGPDAASPRPIERPKVPMPKQFKVVELGSTLEITRRWFGPAMLFLLFFCIFWNGFMIVWHVMALSMGAWFMSCFGLIHTAVGIGLAYSVVAGLFNETTIRVQGGIVEVRHGPVPWPGNKSFASHKVEQVYCKETVHHGKNGVHHTYTVHLVLPGNVRETLVKGLKDCEQALYIEQRLEKFLEIEDRPVSGEVQR